MEITMIAALDEVGGLGKAGRMPWHCPADLRQFQAYTMGRRLSRCAADFWAGS